jgi:ribose 5-phosphate isomerase B
MNKIVVASDHGGVELKQELVSALKEWGWEVDDLGVHDAQSVDYPKYAAAVANRVKADSELLGLLVCGTGQGMCMCANKVGGVRAALCSDVFSARMARQHNDANVLCLGGRVLGSELARTVLKAFLESNFDGGRHARRLSLMRQIEDGSLDGSDP